MKGRFVVDTPVPEEPEPERKVSLKQQSYGVDIYVNGVSIGTLHNETEYLYLNQLDAIGAREIAGIQTHNSRIRIKDVCGFLGTRC